MTKSHAWMTGIMLMSLLAGESLGQGQEQPDHHCRADDASGRNGCHEDDFTPRGGAEPEQR